MSVGNEVRLIGHLGAKPELELVGSKRTAKARLRLATNARWNTVDQATGEVTERERVDWHTIEAWGRKAEILCEHTEKGTQLAVTGELVQEVFHDRKTGDKRYTTHVRLDDFKFLGKKKESTNGAAAYQREPGGDDEPHPADMAS